jgi:adenosylcobinamide-phosphate synthase
MFRIVVILLAFLLDLKLGDPPNIIHPLLLMGHFLSFGKSNLFFSSKLTTRNQFWFGTFWTITGIGLFALPFRKLGRRCKLQKKSLNPITSKKQINSFRPSALLLQPLSLKPVFAYRGLRQAVKDVITALESNNLPEARRLLSWHLVSRDTSQLNSEEIAGAAIESLAENITDSVTAPLLAYAIGGLPLAWAYRFVNTADAMWGYRTEEFEYLGKFPAKLDDAFNWLPARLTGWVLVMAAWLWPKADGRRAAKTMLTQHHCTSSPNAGWTMAAMAGALRLTLTKRDVYELKGGQNNANTTTIKQALYLADICVTLSITLICSGLLIAHVVQPHLKRKTIKHKQI